MKFEEGNTLGKGRLIKIKNSEECAVIDDRDYDRVSKHSWYLSDTGYAFCSKLKKLGNGYYRMHRFILSPESGEHIDHVNANKLDNRRENIGILSQRLNSIKAHPAKSKKSSKYKGVHYDKSRGLWAVDIRSRVKNFRRRIGRYKTEVQAAIAYNVAALDIHGPGCYLNIIRN